jgi:hypothetical protein
MSEKFRLAGRRRWVGHKSAGLEVKIMPCIGSNLCYVRGMEKVIRKFHFFTEAEKADRAYYLSLTPEQRLEILFDMVANPLRDEPEQRLERVCRVVKLQED